MDSMPKLRPAAFIFLFTMLALAQNPHQPPPYWAYPVNPDSAAPAERPDNTPRHLPASTVTFTDAEIHDLFHAIDWHPDGHPPMPEVVAQGRKPNLFACGYCHLPNGLGRPENASLAGLPVGYIIKQIADFKSGARHSSEPKDKPVANMIAYETTASAAELEAAARYFSQLKPKPWIRVVEAATVPKTRIAGWMLVPSTPAATEPIGHRIIETPEDWERTELRDDASAFIVYVPVGSIKKGEALASTGGDGKTPCGTCHGPGLRGHLNVPSIAGRSPSYIVRQLFDIRSGARSGTLSLQMRAQVARLTLDDMIALAAYAASLRP